MKKTVIASILIISTLTIFQTYKKDALKRTDTCTVLTRYDGSAKPMAAVQCANLTCHNAGTCDKELLAEVVQ